MPHLIWVLVALATTQPPGPNVLDPGLHHLRSGDRREWADFPADAEGPRLAVTFREATNAGEHTLRLRQQDVRQSWAVRLNGRELGRLVADENDTELALPVPPGAVRDGENNLSIEAVGREPDDIRAGGLVLDPRPVKAVLSEATVQVTVREEVRPGELVPVPCRLTVLSARGALASTGAASTDRLAVRPGVVYTADGTARFGLPAGEYTLIAGRGFAYGTATHKLTLKPDDVASVSMILHRQVPTPGWVALDPHVHTLTHSGHGDATAVERAVTAAGEGLDVVVATEHNRAVDYTTAAERAGVRGRFTPVAGDELTTAVGHFNVFPLPSGVPPPDHRAKDWAGVATALGKADRPRAVILNHPRDLHAGFRPFGPARHLALTGERLDGWVLPANAVEVVNSGAQQSDPMRPVHDWLGLLNRGVLLTPVGSSDSHDVSRYVVGQGRTYVRCPFGADGDAVVRSFVAGRVLVSSGLLTEITVNGEYGPGDLSPVRGEVTVAARVRGPAWASADRVELYANGALVRQAAIRDPGTAGEKWAGEWRLPQPKHDLHLVAVATGPGVDGLFWPIAKPYQATSPVVRKRVIGLTGAVWVDGDGDGRRTCPYESAAAVVGKAKGDWRAAMLALAGYDEATAAQAAGLLRAAGVSPSDDSVRAAARAAGDQVLRGFEAYAAAWRESEVARQDGRP